MKDFLATPSRATANAVDWRLYLATDDRILNLSCPAEFFAKLIDAGVTALQLRLKSAEDDRFREMARILHEITSAKGVPLIINDRVDIMLEVGADGVHVGRGDQAICEVRKLAGDRIIGYSVNTMDHLRFAVENGADYVGLGPVFATGTKSDTGPVLGLEGLTRLAEACPLPCVGIGGITATRVGNVMGCGVDGVCVISAVLGADDPAGAAAEAAAATSASESALSYSTSRLSSLKKASMNSWRR
mgnify:CR=1 FL=1